MLPQPAYGYRTPVQTTAIQQPVSRYGSPTIGQSYNALATAADKERLAQAQRATGRQNAVIGGYEQQMANSQLMGQQAYNQLSTDYGLVTADAAATRDRNMARVDQYGNSMR